MSLEEACKLINDRVNSKRRTRFFTINEPYISNITRNKGMGKF